MRYTIYDIKMLTEAKQPYFFNSKTMKFFRQTLKSFKVYKNPGGKFLITAPRIDNAGHVMGYTKRIFNPVTNDLEHVESK